MVQSKGFTLFPCQYYPVIPRPIRQPIEPVCAHSSSVLILPEPGSYQPYPDEFTSISRELSTFPVPVSDNDPKNSFKMSPISQNEPNLRNDSL
jgi:hypothetical protein